ncbi:DNA repair protein rad50 [Recurvomyces mirabilis]|nr:DNA repair protein rad50 [Recurvomyces mirabilis]
MSTIDRLQIQGVRSFDNRHPMVIQFEKPLTLIVGPNGSGKTTIIECLRYATTGDLPPNAKQNGAFVHDPALCGEKEVMAQVKLRFKDRGGTVYTCTRSLQLTVKKASRSTSAVETNLLMHKNGEKVSLSSRVADMNALVPGYLGVSRSVLESVIFCHQEESLWPMSSPKDLKERFDAIFEAVKYTKAIDNIRVMAKNYKGKLEVYKNDEEHRRHNKDRAKLIEKQSEKLTVECDELRQQHADLSDRLDQAGRNFETASRKAREAGAIAGQLVGKRIEEKTKEESVQSLRENLKEMSDSDEELQRMVEQYDERVQHHQDDLNAEKQQYSDMNREVQQARDLVSTKERDCGSYEAQAQQYERQIASREKLVKETARSHNIRGFDLQLDAEQVAAFMDRIAKMARDQNATFERTRRETQEKLQLEQQALNDLNQQKTTINGRKENARQVIATNDRKIGSLQSDVNRISIDEGAKATMEASLQDVDTRLATAKADEESSGWEQSLEDAEGALRKLEDRKDKLDGELIEGTRQASETARVDLLRKDVKDRERSLETMISTYSNKINSLIGTEWQPGTVEGDFQRTLDESGEQVADAERQRDGTNREKDQIDFQLGTCRRELKDKRQAVKAAGEKIKKECGVTVEEYTDELRQYEESRANLKSDADSIKLIFEYFEACIKTAKDASKPCCRTCGRGLSKDKKDADQLLKNIEREKQRLQKDLGGTPEDLEQLEKELASFKSVEHEFETWERLKEKELPAHDREEGKLKAAREELIEQLEQQDAVVEERQAAKRDIDAVSRTVQSITKLHKEIIDLRHSVEELSAKQKSQGISRGLEQIQEDLKKTNEEARAAKTRLAKINSDRERSRGMVNGLELQTRDIRSKLSTAEYQLKEKRSLEGQIEDLKKQTSELRDGNKAHDKELQELVPKLARAQAKYDDVARAGADEDRKLQAGLNKLNTSVNQLTLASEDINSYIARGGPTQLERGKRDVEAQKTEVSRLEEEQGQIVRRVKKLEDQLRNHDETRRSIADNQRYRRDLRRLQQVREEISELETHDAERDQAKYAAEGTRWQNEQSNLSAQRSGVAGTLKSKDQILEEILNDYETEYKDAARKYKEAHINVETTKACVADLNSFGTALDQAIMRYHSIKMEEINRIIDELWRKTYQGTDVDTIFIKSSKEGGRTAKSYNYHVCMVKQDAEMDMRGRCSAGQKVLASIIIRLALAECFGVNCGLIALDEPTTNLDKDNIKALAESLSEIIKMRKVQRNFQLIVITHDEEFLKHMNCSEYADTYWRVSRSDTQKSVIERQSIAEVI